MTVNKNKNPQQRLRVLNGILILLLLISTTLHFFNPFKSRERVFKEKIDAQLSTQIDSLYQHEYISNNKLVASDSIQQEWMDAIKNVSAAYIIPICQRTKPTTGNHVQIKLSFKAPDIKVRSFIWDNVDYANGCFDPKEDTHTFIAYLPYTPGKPIPFSWLVKSAKNNNEVTYSFKVYDMSGKIVGQYPSGAESATYKIDYLKYPFSLEDVISLNP